MEYVLLLGHYVLVCVSVRKREEDTYLMYLYVHRLSLEEFTINQKHSMPQRKRNWF